MRMFLRLVSWHTKLDIVYFLATSLNSDVMSI
jgi:hypothetical protein